MAQKFTVPITVKQLTSAGSDAITVYVDADTYARLKVEAGGRLVWGSGSGTGDVNLYRDEADVLRTDDTFKTPILFVDGIEIDTTGAQTDHVLKFNGTKFISASASFGGGGATNLDGLTDVVITAPEEFQGLSYNGTDWVNSHIPLVSYVRNAETTTITTGTCVYLFGSTGDHATVKRADNSSDTTSSKTVGVVGANITASNNGPVVTRGYVDGIDLSVGYTAGDILWLGKNGAFTKTKPTSPDHLVFIGVVVRATNNGIIYVATQNGYELDELHDVAINGKTSGDFLKYNGTLWVNDQINLGTDTVGNYVETVSVSGTGLSVSGSGVESASVTISSNATNANTPSTLVARDASGNFSAGTITAALSGNASTASTLQNSRTIALSGDVSGSVSFNGSSNVSISTTIAADSVALGTDTTGNYVASLVAGTGITLTNGTASEGGTPTISVTSNTYQPLDADLTAIAGLTGTSGVLKKTAADTWALDTSTFVTTADTGTVTSAMIANGTIVDADISNSASISLSKLSTTGATTGNIIKFNGSAWAAAAASGANVTSGTTPPASPNVGDLWLDSANVDLYIYYDNHWVQLTGEEPLVEDINDLADVAAPNPVSGQFLKYDGTYWIPASIPTINALDDVGDVNVTGATSGQFLKWNGTTWVADSIVGGATTSSSAPSSPTTGQLWFDTDDARTYVYYDNYWVEIGASGQGATVSDTAPTNPISGQLWYKSNTGGFYIYYSGVWVEVGASPATFPTGKSIAMSIVFGG